jgi:5-methylthioadenosine/S-adenosylhomocysteine deaminase
MTQLTDARSRCAPSAACRWRTARSRTSSSASGFCPTEKLRLAGVNVAIGTDGCASNNDLDMFDELRSAALLAKGRVGRRHRLERRLRACARPTLAGARAIGLGERIGSLEPGKQADFICVAMDALEAQPLYNAISQLVYSSGRSQVRDAWIAGERRLAEASWSIRQRRPARARAPLARHHRGGARPR